MSIQCNVSTVKMTDIQKTKCPSINALGISCIIYFVIIIIGCFNYYRKKEEYKNNKINEKPRFFNYMKIYFGFGLLISIFVYFYTLNKTNKEIEYNENFIKNLMDKGMDRENAELLLIDDYNHQELEELMRARARRNLIF